MWENAKKMKLLHCGDKTSIDFPYFVVNIVPYNLMISSAMCKNVANGLVAKWHLDSFVTCYSGVLSPTLTKQKKIKDIIQEIKNSFIKMLKPRVFFFNSCTSLL